MAVTVTLCPQSTGNKNGKLWSLDDEVSPEVLAKVRGCSWRRRRRRRRRG